MGIRPVMKLDLVTPMHDDGTGTIDYPARPAGKFQNISSITLFFDENYGLDELYQTEITFIGFKGRATNMKRRAVETVYESRGMKKDHQVPDEYGSTARNLY